MLTLVIGNKELSSWSLRSWLVLKHYGVPFSEIQLPLDTPEFFARIVQYSGAQRVPVLIDGDLHIWDSLAIVEYVNEKVGGRAWPADAALRAHARAVSAEMHSGFQALRQTWPMHSNGSNPHVPLPPQGRADVARVQAIWDDCRARYAARGPWLFGEFSIADAMYAPVVLRFKHYGATGLTASSQAYMQQWLQDALLREWIADAVKELAR
ncbi:MAG TPA: glutathione S-transferase family protein [Steroidobacteraceae bacterium]|nr:glutathione S-transferase family protein [Steroidobacteraceae bacterium]